MATSTLPNYSSSDRWFVRNFPGALYGEAMGKARQQQAFTFKPSPIKLPPVERTAHRARIHRGAWSIRGWRLNGCSSCRSRRCGVSRLCRGRRGWDSSTLSKIRRHVIALSLVIDAPESTGLVARQNTPTSRTRNRNEANHGDHTDYSFCCIHASTRHRLNLFVPT